MTRFIRFLCFAFALSGVSVSAAEITFAELRRNPLWLPETTTLTQEIAFADGGTLPAGQVVAIRRIERNKLVLAWPGKDMTFDVDPALTSVLADAGKRVAAFTPEQKKLTASALRSRKDLWPYTVTFRERKEFNDGTVFEVGAKLPLADFDGRQVKLIEPVKYVSYSFDPSATDFYEACLQAIVSPAPSRVYQELAAALVTQEGAPSVDLLGENAPEYLAIYHAADWCPYCAQTSPDIIAWYRGLQAKGDTRIQLVVISSDKSPEELRRHLDKFGAGVVAVPPEHASKLMVLNQATGVSARSLPDFYVVDRAGKVVIPASKGMPTDRVRAVIDRLQTL